MVLRRLAGLGSRLAEHADQRFPPEQEAAFKQSLQPHFLMPVMIGSSAMLVTSGMYRELNWQGDPLRMAKGLLSGGILVVSLFWISIYCLRRWSARCRFIDLESGILVTVVILHVLYICGGKWYLAQLFGRDPLAEFGHTVLYTETMIVLWVDMSATFICLLLPIRSHVSWTAPCFGLGCLVAVNALTSSPFPDEIPRTIAALICIVLAKWLGGLWQEQHTREKWVAQRRVEEAKDFSQRQHLAFSHLLTRLCDCLVNLGPNFELTESSPRLNAMLFLRDSRSLLGSDFRDLLASQEEAARFGEALAERSSAEDPTGILPMHLKDSQGSHFQVHVYFSCFSDQDGVPYYVIGIVEASGGLADRALAPRLLNQPATCSGMVRPSKLPDFDDISAGGSSLTLESLPHQDLGEVSVTFEDGRDLRVVSTTPGFTALCGPAPADSCLTEWLANEDDFRRWSQHCTNLFNANPVFSNLVLRTPFANSAGVEFVASKVYLDSITCVAADDDDVNMLRVTLYNIKQRCNQLRRSTRHSRRNARAQATPTQLGTRRGSGGENSSRGKCEEDVLDI